MDFDRPLVSGTLVRRLNRFVAEVAVGSRIERVHVPNTGRLQELLVAGATVHLTPVAGTNRQTQWDLTLVQKDAVLCAVDTRLPAKLLLEPVISQVLGVDRFASSHKLEATYGKHRFDLLIEDAQGQLWVEAKTVSLVVEGQAYFPDAPTQRGTSHVRTLTQLALAGGRGVVLFLLLRDDANAMHPHVDTDPAFSAALHEAATAGVILRALRYHVNLQGIHFDQEIPVVL